MVLTPPYHTFEVEQRDSVVALVVFLVVAFTVSVTVDVAARRRVAGVRSQLEADILGRFTTEPVADVAPAAVLDQVMRMFGMTSVALLDETGDESREVARVGPPITTHPALAVDAGPGLRLAAHGPVLFGEDKDLLSRLALAAGRAFEGSQLAEAAAQADRLAEIDRVRSALLAAVSHDLRTPLEGIKAAVSSLRQDDITWATEDEDEFLATIEESTDELTQLVCNLLDMSRVQAGALSLSFTVIALDEVVARALVATPSDAVTEDVPEDLPLVHTDTALLERIVANVVDNARRYSPRGQPATIQADLISPTTVRLQIIDHGPGVPTESYESMFKPFQRLGDRSGEGVGLGLAIARGFSDAMGTSLTPSETPGGGLTMTLTLSAVP